LLFANEKEQLSFRKKGRIRRTNRRKRRNEIYALRLWFIVISK